MSHIDNVIQRIRHDQEKVVIEVDRVADMLDKKREEIQEEIGNARLLLSASRTTEKLWHQKCITARINSLIEEKLSMWLEKLCNLPQLPGSNLHICLH